MKCQFCTKPATVHLTDIVNNVKRETHLCQQCAEAQDLIKQQELNLPAILHSLIGQHLGPQTDELSRLTCPACGIGYMEFRAAGRLGCPHDYAVFGTGLEPLLSKIHRSTRHVGKFPQNKGPSTERLVELVRLRRQLQSAVDAEAYEEAARIRDLLRRLSSSEGQSTKD